MSVIKRKIEAEHFTKIGNIERSINDLKKLS
jgi:hypothetical protein